MLRLPARPWTLQGSVTTRFALLLVLWSLMTLAVVACWFFLSYPAFQDILRQQRIWDRGVRAVDATVRGKTTSHKFVLDSFDLGADLQPFAIGPTELEHLRNTRPVPTT